MSEPAVLSLGLELFDAFSLLLSITALMVTLMAVVLSYVFYKRGDKAAKQLEEVVSEVLTISERVNRDLDTFLKPLLSSVLEQDRATRYVFLEEKFNSRVKDGSLAVEGRGEKAGGLEYESGVIRIDRGVERSGRDGLEFSGKPMTISEQAVGGLDECGSSGHLARMEGEVLAVLHRSTKPLTIEMIQSGLEMKQGPDDSIEVLSLALRSLARKGVVVVEQDTAGRIVFDANG
ncbi:MAG: hypothetical protein AAGD01_18860 [Acidobacteriota bacterium]